MSKKREVDFTENREVPTYNHPVICRNCEEEWMGKFAFGKTVEQQLRARVCPFCGCFTLMRDKLNG